MVGIEWRYLSNIENQGAIPSLPVVIQLIKVCDLPVERYFNPKIMREESKQRQRVSHKLKLCPEAYLPIIEGAIDGAMKMEQTAKQKEDLSKQPFISQDAKARCKHLIGRAHVQVQAGHDVVVGLPLIP